MPELEGQQRHEIIQCLSQEFGSAMIKLRGERNSEFQICYTIGALPGIKLWIGQRLTLFCFFVIAEISA